MTRRYSTIKTPLTYEEKVERATFYNEYSGGQKVDVEEFAKQEIFEESIHLKCIKCGYEETSEADIILEICYDMEYPQLQCPKCGHTKKQGILVPIDIYNSDFKK